MLCGCDKYNYTIIIMNLLMITAATQKHTLNCVLCNCIVVNIFYRKREKKSIKKDNNSDFGMLFSLSLSPSILYIQFMANNKDIQLGP